MTARRVGRRAVLRALGCSYAQGYLFDKPMEREVFGGDSGVQVRTAKDLVFSPALRLSLPPISSRFLINRDVHLAEKSPTWNPIDDSLKVRYFYEIGHGDFHSHV